MAFKPAKWPRKLRSQEWFGGTSKDAIYHRSWMKNQGLPADLLDVAVENAVIEALKTAPGAVAKAKLLFRNLVGDVDQETVDTTIMALADCWESDETRKGLEAFFNKQSMPWTLK